MDKKMNMDRREKAFLLSVVALVFRSSIAVAAFGDPCFSAGSGATNVRVRASSPSAVAFRVARPVWPKGHGKDVMGFFGFRSSFRAKSGDRPVLKIAAASFYRVFVNGQFVGHGPVRAAHGYFRTDEWPLEAVVHEGENAVAVEVLNYNLVTANGPCTQPGFLQCEVTVRDEVVAATGRDFGFLELPRVKGTSRITRQRAPIEMYRLNRQSDEWRTAAAWRGKTPETLPSVKLLPRRTPYPRFDIAKPAAYATSAFDYDERTPPKNAALAFDGADELSRLGNVAVAPTHESVGSISVSRGFLADFGRIDSGFIAFDVACEAPCRIVAVFDEKLTGGIPDPVRRYYNATASVWEFTEAGRYRVEMFEPTGVRYLHFFARRGLAQISNVRLREYKNSRVYAADFTCSDERLNRVFAAARETCAQNTMDATLDCVTRERNSGPCDAYFTLGGYEILTGDYELERLFFENYALASSYPGLDTPVLPAFYPCDQISSLWAEIPPYMTWFALQLERHTAETGDVTVRDQLRERLLRLPAHFRKHYNAEGLIEDIPGMVFLDWSRATDFRNGVSYPMNMIWAEGLDALARLYGQKELSVEAAALREKIRVHGRGKRWFRDHDVRQADGTLVRKEEISELCQCYAFRFGVATPQSDPAYWEDFVKALGRSGPHQAKAMGEVCPANYFEGIMIRHELLSTNGRHAEAVRELGYLVDMTDETGTLGEGYANLSTGYADRDIYSGSQGFGSYAAALIFRSGLGLVSLDRANRRVTLAAPDNGLRQAAGRIPTAEGPIVYKWRRVAAGLEESVSLPPGWTRDGGDAALLAPPIWTAPDVPARYRPENEHFAMNNGAALTKGGRLWVSWIGGGDDPTAYVLGAYSDDRGQTWTNPALVIDGHFTEGPVKCSNIIANFWTDPTGVLHLFFSQVGGTTSLSDGRWGVWETVCADPDAAKPIWSRPRRLCFGAVLNKPLVTRDGTWLVPVEMPVYHQRLASAGVLASTDEGRNWILRDMVEVPDSSFPENNVLELADGRLRMYMRSRVGLKMCESADQGRTWGEIRKPVGINQIVSRAQFRKLRSGNWVFLRNGGGIDTYLPMTCDEDRVGIDVFLSSDEGRSWTKGLTLDSSAYVSYPDIDEGADGLLYVTHDFERMKGAEIRLHIIREADIVAGKIVSPDARLGLVVTKAGRK